MKVFFTKFGGVVSIGAQVNKRVLRENHIFCQIVEVFSLKSFALYGMTLNVLLSVKCLFVLACSSSMYMLKLCVLNFC